jgi:LysR family transcriptional regulator, hydrogen peroxide-inducible genes activator
LKLGVIPTLAPYLLPKLLPLLQARHPDLVVKLRETQTKALAEELVAGDLDAVTLSMPAPEADIEVIRLFDDPFLLAVPADDARPETARVRTDEVDLSRLILLEEGGPLPARPGACLLLDRETRHAPEPRRDQSCDHHANGSQRLRRHALT